MSLTTPRNRASRSGCSSRDLRIVSSVAATESEAGERFDPSVTARSGRSVGAAEDDAHAGRDLPEIDVDAVVAEVRPMYVRAKPGAAASEEPDSAADVVGDLHLVAEGIRIGDEPEGADVDEAGAAAHEGDDTITPCHEKVVVVVDLPPQEIDVEIVGAVLRARTEEPELDQVVLGPVVTESEAEIPRVLEHLFAFRLLERQVPDVWVELPGLLPILRMGGPGPSRQTGKREQRGLHQQATHLDLMISVRIPLQKVPALSRRNSGPARRIADGAPQNAVRPTPASPA